nr:FecR family protein [Saprospiraceae bacterium]
TLQEVRAALEKFKATRMPPKVATVRRIDWRWYVGAAASVALLLGIWFWVGSRSLSLEAAAGEMAERTFNDGSSIVLNDGSSIIYQDGDWGKERIVDLQGEALFEVTKGVPFIVKTDQGTVQVLGTSFNVRAWDQHFRVECYSGKVAIERNGQRDTLVAGEAGQWRDNQWYIEQDLMAQSPAWSEGKSEFKGESWDAAFAELERQYDVKLERPYIDSPFVGNFQHNNLDTALYLLTRPKGLQYEIDRDRSVVRIFR